MSIKVHHRSRGSALRAARLERGVTQAQLGRIAGVSEGAVARLERRPQPSPALPQILMGLLALHWLEEVEYVEFGRGRSTNGREAA